MNHAPRLHKHWLSTVRLGAYSYSRRQTATGFSLIETIITLTILVIILGISIFTYKTFVGKSKLTQIQTFLSEVAERQNAQFLDKRKYSENLADLQLSLPTAFINTVQAFKMVVYKTPEGRSSYLAVAVPNSHNPQTSSYYPLVVNPDTQYYSLNLACQGIRESDDGAYVASSCSYRGTDVTWKKKAEKVTLTAANLQQNPPAPITGVTGDCAYAITLRDRVLFDSFGCSAKYNWPYATEDSPPISDACLTAFESGDRLAFTQANCCSSNAWISKATGYCADSGSAQPSGLDAYVSPETAGNVKHGDGCWAIIGTPQAGSSVVSGKCENVTSQKWYKGSDGLWRTLANPNLCLTAPTVKYTTAPATVQNCNPKNAGQVFTVVRNETTGTEVVKVNNNFHCMSAIGSSGFRLSSSGCTNVPVAFDFDSELAAHPVCDSAIKSNDYAAYKNGGCCDIVEWNNNNIDCSSPPVTIGSTPSTATNIGFSNGSCWNVSDTTLATGSSITNAPCDSGNANQKWYQTADMRWHPKDDPSLCLQISGSYATTKANLQPCDDANLSQKMWVEAGIVKVGNGFRCMNGFYLTSNIATCTGNYVITPQ